MSASRWGEADADPLADIESWKDLMMLGHPPTRIIMSRRHWMRLARGTMSKRQFRRWRGKQKE